jgi:para-aminobenzoate synthetase/4-amino-4-deoxychorismate lyase
VALAPFALLDDCTATPGVRKSRLYTGLVREHVCDDAAAFARTCERAGADTRAGLHAVIVADYEFGARLAGVAPDSAAPGAWRFLMFSACDRLDAAEAGRWLDGQLAGGAPAGVVDVQHSVSPGEYTAALAQVHAALAAGDVYQVNYTFRTRFRVYGPPVALYAALRARQPVPYGALLALPDGRWVLSASPELFVRHDRGRLVARPMKGTAPRRADAVADRAEAHWLAGSQKNRAENLMIVDLLRNDLGRVARTGTVRVPSLFEVEPYSTVWQMTSTIEAEPAPGVSFAGIMRALFPCGSITGAPKHRALQRIAALEAAPRGLYTGAIGWLDAPEGNDPLPPFCLSVAIRTAVLDARPDAAGLRAGELGIGGGIVMDSAIESEYDEAALKARFLTGLAPAFSLFETMYASRSAGVRHFERHLDRLHACAVRLRLVCDIAGVRRQVDAHVRGLPDEGPWRIRLTLEPDGRADVASFRLRPLPPGPVRIALASAHGFGATDSADFLLRFKTTHRERYDRAWRAAEALGAFDLLFSNEAGYLTEGGRSNLFVRRDGRWYTPPLDAGVLPGVMRAVLLDDPAWRVRERNLTVDDLHAADKIVVCNALRGVLPALLLA